MIYTFRFISDEEDSFVIDVNINHNQTFEQLHKAIQDILKFDESQLASFYTSNDEWEKLDEIALLTMDEDSDVKIMQETYIDDIFTEKNQHILYVFDYFNERLFFGSITRTIDAKSPIELPSVSKMEGNIPAQFKEMEIEESVDDDYDDFEDEGDFDFDDLPEDYGDFNPNDY